MHACVSEHAIQTATEALLWSAPCLRCSRGGANTFLAAFLEPAKQRRQTTATAHLDLARQQVLGHKPHPDSVPGLGRGGGQTRPKTAIAFSASGALPSCRRQLTMAFCDSLFGLVCRVARAWGKLRRKQNSHPPGPPNRRERLTSSSGPPRLTARQPDLGFAAHGVAAASPEQTVPESFLLPAWRARDQSSRPV